VHYTITEESTIFWNVTPFIRYKLTDISVEHNCPIFGVEEQPTSKKQAANTSQHAVCLLGLFLDPKYGGNNVAPKRWYISTELHGVTSHKTTLHLCENLKTELRVSLYGYYEFVTRLFLNYHTYICRMWRMCLYRIDYAIGLNFV
jgi:hypothetical protein